MTIAAADVRNYLALTTDSTSRYSDATINSNIATGQEFLRKATNRYYESANVTLTLTSNGEPLLDLPGVRSVTSVTQAGTTLVADTTYWLLPDDQNSGVYTQLQLRAFTASGLWWYKAIPEWFDRNLDSPNYPPSYGMGYGSLPNDVVVTGTAGYLDANLPAPYLMALKVLATWYTKRPDAVLSGASQTNDGNPLDLTLIPEEVQMFIREWKIGTHTVVSL